MDMATLESIQLQVKKRLPDLLFTLLSLMTSESLHHVVEKISKSLSHPFLGPYSDLYCFQSCLQSTVWFLLADFVCVCVCVCVCSSKSGLHFNELVILPLGNQFLSTISKSISLQHIELDLSVYFTYEHIHWFYTIPQCGQVGSWSALYPPIKNTNIYVCFTGMWVGFCQPSCKAWTARLS